MFLYNGNDEESVNEAGEPYGRVYIVDKWDSSRIQFKKWIIFIFARQEAPVWALGLLYPAVGAILGLCASPFTSTMQRRWGIMTKTAKQSSFYISWPINFRPEAVQQGQEGAENRLAKYLQTLGDLVTDAYWAQICICNVCTLLTCWKPMYWILIYFRLKNFSPVNVCKPIYDFGNDALQHFLLLIAILCACD